MMDNTGVGIGGQNKVGVWGLEKHVHFSQLWPAASLQL